MLDVPPLWDAARSMLGLAGYMAASMRKEPIRPDRIVAVDDKTRVHHHSYSIGDTEHGIALIYRDG